MNPFYEVNQNLILRKSFFLYYLFVLAYLHFNLLLMMKSTLKSFDNVKFMRQQRDKLSEKLPELTKVEAVRKLNFEIKTVTC